MIHCVFLTGTEPFQHLKHSLDIWHKAKKLAFMLGEKAKKAPNKDLLPWIRPVVNHFWYCCSISKGSTEKLLKRWCGILHHITNQHFWPGGRYVIHVHGKFHQLYHLFYSQSEELSINSYMYFFTFLQMSSCNRSII